MKYIQHLYGMNMKIYPTGLCVEDLVPNKCYNLGGLKTSAGRVQPEEVITVCMSLEAISCPVLVLCFLSASWQRRSKQLSSTISLQP